MGNLQTDTPLQLYFLHITSEKPDRLADFYESQMGLQKSKEDELWVMRGGARSVVISHGPSASLLYPGYAVGDQQSLMKLKERLQANGVELEPLSSPLYREGAFLVVDPQGRKIAFGERIPVQIQDVMPARLQHTVFQTTELETVVKFYTEALGFAVSDEVVNEEGKAMVVFLRSDDEHHSLAFFRGSKNEWDHHCYETNEWNDIRDWGDSFAKLRIPIFFGPGRHGRPGAA